MPNHYRTETLDRTLDLTGELALLRRCVAVILDEVDPDLRHATLPTALRAVADTCRKMESVPRVVTEDDLADIAESNGVERDDFLLRLNAVAYPPPAQLVDAVVLAMDATVPYVGDVPREVIAEVYTSAVVPSQRLPKKRRRKPSYLMSDKLRRECERDGADARSPIEELGLARRLCRENVALFEAARQTRRADLIIEAISALQMQLMLVIDIAVIAARILKPIYTCTLQMRALRMSTPFTRWAGGRPFDDEFHRWERVAVEIEALLGGLLGRDPAPTGTNLLPCHSR